MIRDTTLPLSALLGSLLRLRSLLCGLQFQHLLHNLLLLHQERPDNPLLHHAGGQVSSVRPMDSLVLLADRAQGPRADSRHTMQALSRNGADGVGSLLLQRLELQTASGGLDDPLLVRLGRVRVTATVRESLHHDVGLWICGVVKRVA